MEMTNANFKAFREDFKAAVAALEKKYEVTLTIGSISYTENYFSTKLTGVTGASAEEPERNEFERNVRAVGICGLTKKDYGRKFVTPRGTFALVGIRPRAHKAPLLVRDEKGKQYACAPSFLGLMAGGPIGVGA